MAKSYVTLVQNSCPICGTLHDTGELLLDRRLKNTFERKTVTGFSLCSACKELEKDYIGVVGIDESKSRAPYKPDTVWRTGTVLHLKRNVSATVFNIPNIETLSFIYADNECIEMLLTIGNSK